MWPGMDEHGPSEGRFSFNIFSDRTVNFFLTVRSCCDSSRKKDTHHVRPIRYFMYVRRWFDKLARQADRQAQTNFTASQARQQAPTNGSSTATSCYSKNMRWVVRKVYWSVAKVYWSVPPCWSVLVSNDKSLLPFRSFEKVNPTTSLHNLKKSITSNPLSKSELCDHSPCLPLC